MEGQISSLEEKKTAAEQALHRVQNEMREAQDLVNATKKHSAVLQDTLTVSADLSNTALSFSHRVSLFFFLRVQQTVKEKDVVQRALGHTQTSLEHTHQQNSELQREVGGVLGKLAELKKEVARDAENTKKALEKAITASVRLCVVAPTVNVHVSDKKLKFKAGSVNFSMIVQ